MQKMLRNDPKGLLHLLKRKSRCNLMERFAHSESAFTHNPVFQHQLLFLAFLTVMIYTDVAFVITKISHCKCFSKKKEEANKNLITKILISDISGIKTQNKVSNNLKTDF